MGRVEVVDGDTLAVERRGQRERVRIVGIDTPEMGWDGRPAQCWAERATQELRERVAEGEVVLLPDEASGERDRYGRLLRRVHVDGEDVGLGMLVEGHARRYVQMSLGSGLAQVYRAAEARAKRAGAGLWGRCG